MAAPYHADVTGVPNGAPSIASHTPNCHANGTSSVLSILQNDTPSHQTDIPTGTPSFATQSTKHNVEGTNRGVGTSVRDYNNDHRLEI
eukprot:scaffold50420_cov68-Attheya_sp.AAC.1